MNTLVIIRHGAYDLLTMQLNSEGITQIETISDSLTIRLSGMKVLILSSVALRAVESAEIVARKLDILFEEHDVLNPDEELLQRMSVLLQLVKSKGKKVDALILVTHYEHCEYFPRFFGEEVLGVRFPVDYCGKGEGYVIDCKAKSIVKI